MYTIRVPGSYHIPEMLFIFLNLVIVKEMAMPSVQMLAVQVGGLNCDFRLVAVNSNPMHSYRGFLW